MSSLSHVGYRAVASILVLVLVSARSFAEPAPPDCESRNRTFATELAILQTLSTCYATRSADEDREYFAAILRAADGFVFVVDAGRHGVDEVSLRFTPKHGEVFVALWHTHGAQGLLRDFFSPTDTALVKRLCVPFYLTSPSGDLRVFRPGDPVRSPPRNRATVRPPTGAAVGTVLVADR